MASDTRVTTKGAGARQEAEGRTQPRMVAGTPATLPRSATLSSPTDQLNRAIVRLLQEDGRLPFKTIAEKLGTSEGTVRNRVGWMKSSGMLRIVAVADPTAMNYRADAMLGIKVASGSTPAKVGERLAVHPEVVYILWVSGRFDLLVERRAWFEPEMQRLVAFCRSDGFRQKAAELQGYGVSGFGRVRFNGP